MFDRILGMIGTLGLVLILSACLPSATAFAASNANGCSGTCGDDPADAKFCKDTGDPCSGTINGVPGGTACGCDKFSGKCDCDA